MSYLIKKVDILYPRVDKPYRFDNTEGRSIPCGPLEKGAKYETKFRMGEETATALMQVMAVAYNEKRKKNWPEKVPMPFDRDEDGAYIGKCNLKGTFDGIEAVNPPKHFDAKNNELAEGFQLTTGSIANLYVEPVPYHGGGDIGTGVSLRLRAVQVITYKPLEALSPFEVDEEGFESGSPFGASTEGFDSKTEAPTANVFSAEPKAAAEEVVDFVAEVVEAPKKKVKSKTTAPKDDVDLSALVANWDD